MMVIMRESATEQDVAHVVARIEEIGASAPISSGERVTIIGVRLAIIKLALLCNCSSGGKEPLEILVVRVVQSVSRFLDHLGDAEFSLKIFAETGWIHEGRMRGLLEK